METSDHDLLRQYVEGHSQEAFATLVGRYVNLVYSVALRRVRSSQLAEEVSQSVFTDLARNADKLRADTVLGAWLHSVAYRTAIDVVRGESRRQAREQKAPEMAAMDSIPSDWSLIEGLLDEGMDTLDETDRSAIVLRYFENKSLREVGATLGTSDDAAQKRVSRAVERLREFFAKRGVTVGAGFYEARQASVLRGQVQTFQEQIQTLQQQQAPLNDQIQHLQNERDNAKNQLAAMQGENEQW